jgi:hypothetical protein
MSTIVDRLGDVNQVFLGPVYFFFLKRFPIIFMVYCIFFM